MGTIRVKKTHFLGLFLVSKIISDTLLLLAGSAGRRNTWSLETAEDWQEVRGGFS